MRFSNLNLPFWGDEYQTINVASGIGILPGPPNLVHAIELQRSEMMHPPIFMIVLHFWLKVSRDVTWVRLLPSIIGLVGLIYLIKIGHEMRLKPVSILLLTSLTTTSWVFVHYSEEVGTYSLAISSAFALIYYLVKYFNRSNKTNLTIILLASLFVMQVYYGSWFYIPAIGIYLLYRAYKFKLYPHFVTYVIAIALAASLLYFDQLRHKIDLAASSYLTVHKLNSAPITLVPRKLIKDNIDYFTYVLGATPWYLDATFFPTTDRFGSSFIRQYYLSLFFVTIIVLCHYLHLSRGRPRKLTSPYFLFMTLLLVNLASFLGYYPSGAIRMSLFYAPLVIWILMEYIDMLIDNLSLMSFIVIFAIALIIINGLTRLNRVPQRHIGKNIVIPIYCSA